MATTVFYRVHHEESQVEYSISTGFTAATQIPGNLPSLLRNLTPDGQIVQHFANHCNRYYIPTALISMCSSPEITLKRARDYREANQRVNVFIYEIHPRRARIRFEYRDARDLARKIRSLTGEAVVEYQNWGHLDQEFVAFNQIPREAIEQCWSVEEFGRRCEGVQQ